MSLLISSCCHEPVKKYGGYDVYVCQYCKGECDIIDATDEPDYMTPSQLAEIKADQKDEAQHRRDYENNLLPKY